jgi:hypothetical protein
MWKKRKQKPTDGIEIIDKCFVCCIAFIEYADDTLMTTYRSERFARSIENW